MANFIAMALVRDVHLRALTRRRAAAARGRARGRPRLRQRPDALLDRPGARRAGLPARDARPRPRRRRVPAPRGAGRRGDRRRTAPQACGPVAIAAVAGLDEHGLGRPRPGARGARRARGPVAPRRRGVRRRGPAVGARRGPRPRPRPRRQRHGRSPQVVLPGLRRRRAAGPRRAAPAPGVRPLARVLPRRRGGRRAGDDRRPPTPPTTTPASSTSTSSASRGPAGSGRLKLWATWKHLGTSGLGRLIEANDDIAAYLAAACAEADDLEALPERARAVSVVCFRHLPGGRGGRATPWHPRDLDAHQDRLAAALEASGDGWLSTTSLRGATWLRAGDRQLPDRPRPTSTGCSRRSAGSPSGPSRPRAPRAGPSPSSTRPPAAGTTPGPRTAPARAGTRATRSPAARRRRPTPRPASRATA